MPNDPVLTRHAPDKSAAAAPAASDSATKQLTASASAEFIVETSDKRILTIRKPATLAIFNFVKMMGGEVAGNQTYMNMVMPLIYLKAIDSSEVRLPMSPREVDALIQRLDESGLNALNKCILENFGESMDTEVAAAAIKK